jgi:hypothetical protein
LEGGLVTAGFDNVELLRVGVLERAPPRIPPPPEPDADTNVFFGEFPFVFEPDSDLLLAGCMVKAEDVVRK